VRDLGGKITVAVFLFLFVFLLQNICCLHYTRNPVEPHAKFKEIELYSTLRI